MSVLVQHLWFIFTYMYSVCGSFPLTCTVWFISTYVYSVCGSFPVWCTVFVVHFHLRVQCLWFISSYVYSVCGSFSLDQIVCRTRCLFSRVVCSLESLITSIKIKVHIQCYPFYSQRHGMNCLTLPDTACNPF